MPYVAIINVPGYMPEVEPVPFDTAWDAWDYLADIRRNMEDTVLEPSDSYSETVLALEGNSMRRMADYSLYAYTGTVYGPTPGYVGDHDLGFAYSVEYISDDEWEGES
jgi:hypothetical protein